MTSLGAESSCRRARPAGWPLIDVLTDDARVGVPHWVGLTATLGHEVFAYGAKTMTSPPPYGPGSAYVVFSQRQGPTLCIIVSPHCLVSMPRPSRQHRVAAFGLMETDVKDRHGHAPGADTADITGSHTML